MRRGASATVLPLLQETTPLLQTRRFGRAVESYVSLGSTNTRAAAWAAEGAPEGSLVVAEHQTQGRGRHGRSWQARAGQNLTFSLVLRPALPTDGLGLITLAAGVAVCEAVELFVAPLRPAIKWPNDVLLNGRKCCGMLLEAAVEGRREARPEAVVLGIGLNVNQDDFPADLVPAPTSLLLESGRLIPRAPLLARLLERLEAQYDALFEGGSRAARCAYEARLARLGQPVTLRFAGSERRVEGIVEGVTADGALCLRTPDGPRAFHAGEVTTH